MSESDLWNEIARLRGENEALNEQMMLLVQTEQRLYRSQSLLDHQLVRVRALAHFSLESGHGETPSEILGRALEVLDGGFELDWAGALAVEDEPPGVRVLRSLDDAEGDAFVAPGPDAIAWLRAQGEPVVVTAASTAHGVASALVDSLADSGARLPAGSQGAAAFIPVPDAGGGKAGFLLALSTHRSPVSLRDRTLLQSDLPYLQLLAHHVEHAVANARLTERLHERSAELALSLERLETAQAALVQSQKMEAIGRLAGGVAHDFNNLLTVIMGYAGTLAAGLPAGSPQHENARNILEAGRRASAITSQLLALGRRSRLALEDLDPAEEARRTVELLRRLVGDHISIRLELDRGVGTVRADRSQYEQIVLNLVVNARDAMAEGGEMRIATRRANAHDAARCGCEVDAAAYGVLEVEDAGVGMDESTRSRIFEPFFTTKSEGKGTGLGLAVVYGIVKQCGGHILVASEPGRGSCFTVLLPLSAPAIPGEGRTAHASAGDTTRASRVLVVEDEQGIRDVIAHTLRRAGYDVAVAANGDEALAWLEREKWPPDFVLTDVTMPVIGGQRLAEEIARRHPGLPVAFMSGYFEDAPREGTPPPSGFLPKPFSPEELLAFVRAQLPAARVAGGATGTSRS